MPRIFFTFTFACLLLNLQSLDASDTGAEQKPSVIEIANGPSAQYELQSALINAIPGDVIQLSAGTYRFESELNIACDNLTIRGAGHTETILSFKEQKVGSNGVVSTGNAFVIEDLAVEDTKGNAVKVLGAKDVRFKGVRVEWTDGPKSTNGAYGIYPVECQNVLIDQCISIGASDAGIYVGQSQDVIVRNCTARKNVAGIEIENTLRADVYDNVAEENTGGILVFDLPGLNITNGGSVRVYRNRIEANNHANFAPKGTMVADVPAGTGVMVMATDNVEIYQNKITSNETSNIAVVSFLITERKINDKKYDPYPEAFSIHDNEISGGGTKPSGKIGALLSPVTGLPFPDIFFDGIVDSKKLVEGRLPVKLRPSIRDNGDATFANVHIDKFSPTNLLTGRYRIERDMAAYDGTPQLEPPVTLRAHPAPVPNGNPAVTVYRAAPKKLSGWTLFEQTGEQISFVDDLLQYELNTPLFSDYAGKHRVVRLPSGAKVEWSADASLEFPVGTVIAKSFTYPEATASGATRERFVETRVEFRQESGWYGYSYIWNADQTDADLHLGGGAVDVNWIDESGQPQSIEYQIPNANQCLSCHGQHGKYAPLGTTVRNMNRPTKHDPALNQLQEWIDHGALKGAPAAKDRPVLAKFDDQKSGSIDARARAWLDVNCAHCHNPGGSARTTGLDLRVTQTTPAKYGVFKSPVAVGKGSGGRQYDIVPGKPDESILMFRLETDETGARMPSLGRSLVHHPSNELIREWIASMPAPEDQN